MRDHTSLGDLTTAFAHSDYRAEPANQYRHQPDYAAVCRVRRPETDAILLWLRVA
jgi:hypothetical protein